MDDSHGPLTDHEGVARLAAYTFQLVAVFSPAGAVPSAVIITELLLRAIL
jgi:hypothetical protein